MSTGVVALKRKRTKQLVLVAMAGAGSLLGGCSVDVARFGDSSSGSGLYPSSLAGAYPQGVGEGAAWPERAANVAPQAGSSPIQLARNDPAANAGYLQTARLDLPPLKTPPVAPGEARPGTTVADGYGRYNPGSATDGVYAGPRVTSPYDRPRDGGDDSRSSYRDPDRRPATDSSSAGDYPVHTSTDGNAAPSNGREPERRDGPREGVYERMPDRPYNAPGGSDRRSRSDIGRERDPRGSGGERDLPARVGPQSAAAGTVRVRPVRCGPEARCHTIRPGDTPGSIAKQYGVPIKRILEANRLPDSHALIAGKSVVIPWADPQPAKVAIAAPPPAKAMSVPSSPHPAAPDETPSQAIAMATPDRGAAPQFQPAPPAAAAPEPACDASLSNPLPRSGNTFRKPVEGLTIGQFGAQRDGSINEGVTISVPKGTPIKAAENGVVAYVGDELAGFGNLILIRHADDYVTAYANADEVLVRKCDVVKRGQVVAKAGVTGGVTQPQLHFEIRKNSKPVDPGPLLAS